MVTSSADQDTEYFYVSFGAKVRSKRTDAGLSQLALARHIGFTRSSVANLEAGRQRVSLHLFVRIARALNLDPCELLPSERIDSGADVLHRVSEELAQESDKTQEFVRGAVAQLVSDSNS